MTRPVRREPLAVALVVINIFLGGALVYRYVNRREAPRLPPGHPDVSVPSSLPADAAMGSGAGNPALSPDLAAIEQAANMGAAPTAAFAISGIVKLSPKLKEPWPAGAFVFVIARAEGGGPPFAVRRYSAVKAPFKFSLGPENFMLSGAVAPKRLVISVRVDQDGDAISRQLGDLEGGPSAPVAPRASVDVIVDRPVQLEPAR